MMKVVRDTRNVYEDFELESDILYYRIGSLGIVSFHGRNYNIKKRMTTEQIKQLTNEPSFFQVSSNCFINLRKVKSIEGGKVLFGTDYSESKQVEVPRRKQVVIEKLFTQQSSSTSLRRTP
ncbi:LytTR family transcriptional regulator DNA-binding domain-containing protein [Paenibacillus sp. GCM10023252]|uniref:LytTR family transcriptional regulator DNA-binding domain-containing protein n=1 Tax=Paenibacillus sp. GCM10023252 TaxID=3252649 RepID=UPI003619020E